MEIHPENLHWPWEKGVALDKHTISSHYLGENEYGRAQYDTRRSEIGEVLFQFKYRGQKSLVKTLGTAVEFYVKKCWPDVIDIIVPMPPSQKARQYQPVIEIAQVSSELLEYPCLLDLLKKNTKETLKDIETKEEKIRKLTGKMTVHEEERIKGKKILLLDDIYHTGASAETASQILLDSGAESVYLITITRRRSG